MSSIKKPQGWLYLTAFAAAFWITFRVMAAAPVPVHGASVAAEVQDLEVRDPALEQMIGHFAAAPGAQRP